MPQLMPGLNPKQGTATDEVLRVIEADGPCTAQHIADKVGVTRAEVNSVLYAEVGVLWLRHGDSPPHWFTNSALLQVGSDSTEVPGEWGSSQIIGSKHDRQTRVSQSPALTTHSLPRRTLGNIEMILPNGKWKVTVILESRSRNDPLVTCEKRAPRDILVTVSTHVSSNPSLLGSAEAQLSDDGVFMAMTSCVAWAYLNEQPHQSLETTDFGLLLRDVYLAAAAAAQITK